MTISGETSSMNIKTGCGNKNECETGFLCSLKVTSQKMQRKRKSRDNWQHHCIHVISVNSTSCGTIWPLTIGESRGKTSELRVEEDISSLFIYSCPNA